MQDATAGIYVHVLAQSPANDEPDISLQLAPPPGTLVEIEGFSEFGRFSPHIEIGGKLGRLPRIRALGKSQLPTPLRLSIDQLSEPCYHDQWVEVAGAVRSVGSEGIDTNQVENFHRGHGV